MINHNTWDERKSKHKYFSQRRKKKVYLLHPVPFTGWRVKWLSSKWKSNQSSFKWALPGLLPKPHVSSPTQKRKVWISTYHIKIVGLCAVVNHSSALQPPWVALDQIAISAFPLTGKDKWRQGSGLLQMEKKNSYITKTSFKQRYMPHLPLCAPHAKQLPGEQEREKVPVWYSPSSARHG